MREIKFRAWDTRNQCYWQWELKKFFQDGQVNCHYVFAHGDIWSEVGEILNDPNYIVEQYTGLKDKNGKEIYEGDILRWGAKKGKIFGKMTLEDDPISLFLGVKPGEISNDSTFTDAIEFHNGSFFLMCADTGGGAYLKRENENAEIIGNIYENPELLRNE